MAERHDAHGYWLSEAGPFEPAGPLEGDTTADLAVVGGGFTGLWTAWHLKQLEPGADVVLCEADLSGHGPSGRNGGFCNALWFSLPPLRRRFGDEAAMAVAAAAEDAVTAIGRFCAEQGVDAWYRRSGYLQVSTAPAWDGAWDEALAACRALGRPDACVELDRDALRERCDLPLFRGAGFYPQGATVQPARLAIGLRARLLDAGVRIFEHTPATVRRRGGAVVCEAPGGAVTARAAVVGIGAKVAGLRPVRRRLTVTSSHIVLTEPVPDVLDAIGWTGGECISDSRAMLHYFRTTPDGRIAFGWGGGRVVFDSRIRGRAELDPQVIGRVEQHLIRFFPQLAGRRIEHAWGGPIDVSPSHLPVVETLDERVHCAFGYTGHGVGPSHMLARSLASLALDRRDEPSRLAFVSPQPVRVPPEPFRYLGGALIRGAILRQETAQENGGRAGPLTRFVAGIPERIGVHIGR